MLKMDAVETNPVIKWAQNKEKIFINFKLSHRQDSPPCSDVIYDQFNITNVENVNGDFKIRLLERENQTSSFKFQSKPSLNYRLMFIYESETSI